MGRSDGSSYGSGGGRACGKAAPFTRGLDWPRSETIASGLRDTLHAREAQYLGLAAPSLGARLDAAREAAGQPPRRGVAVVWLRFIFAKLDQPVVQIGSAVTLYQAAWLRRALLNAQPFDELPPEALEDATELLIFCGAHSAESDLPERPVTYIRVAVGDGLLAHALAVGRATAEALGAVAVLYGAEPTLWRVDESRSLSFVDGKLHHESLGGPVWDSAGHRERVGVARDQTSRTLRRLADRLGSHLPVRDDNAIEAATTLLIWLRGALTAPEPLRLVLCDRVVETVCGWAGRTSPRQFVVDELIPWWAHARIRADILAAGFEAIDGNDFRRHPPGTSGRSMWEEIANHPPLCVGEGDRRTISLPGVLTELQWVIDRTPPGSAARARLVELQRRAATGKRAAAWWTDLCSEGKRTEARRLRVRNALMHGGPLTPATITSVSAFAENLARLALAASIEGRLLGNDLVDHFLDRGRRLSDIRARLGANEAPASILFWE